MKNETAHDVRSKLRAFFCHRHLWIVLLLLTVIYVSIIIIISVSPSPVFSRQYNVGFESANIDISTVPIEIINPSFELGNGQFVGWEPAVWDGYPAFYQLSNMSKTGAHSVLISATSPASAALITSKPEKYSVISGKTYFATVWVTVANISEGYGAVISIAWFNSSDAHISTTVGGSLSSTSSWTKIFVSGQAPQGAISAQLELHLEGVGSAFYDGVTFSRVMTEYGVATWNASKIGLEEARLTANDSSLTLEGKFAYQSDEKLICNTSLISSNVNTGEFAWLEITYKTSSPNVGGLSLALNYEDGTRIMVYGIAFSEDWKTTYIDIRKTPAYLSEFSDQSTTAQSKPVESIEIILDDKPDSTAMETSNVSVENLVFYKYTNIDIFLAILSAILLFFVLMMTIEQTKINLTWSLAIVGGLLSFGGSIYRIILPFLPIVYNNIDVLTILQLGSSLIIFGVIVRKLEVKNDVFSELKIGYSKNNKMIIGLILGLLVIPLIGFLLRFNNALTLPLFDDELSHGVTAWGLSQGRFVGLNLAGPWDPVTSNLLQTGAYKVEPWPSVLSMPFVGTLIYPSFTLVSPFIEPFMTYLFANPFLQVFGFNEIGIRLPFIIMNILIIMLVYIIASRNGNILAGVLGSLFFALNPYSSHYGSKAFLDNGVGLFFVISFYLFLKYKDKFSNPSATKYLYLSATFAAFSTLSKIGAIFAPAFFLIALLTIRNIKRSSFMKAFVLIIGIISIYPVIGLLTSPEAFLLSMSGFSSYTQKATSVASSGALPVFAHMVLIGATLVGLLCLTYLISIKEKDKIYIILASVVYILILLFAFTYAKEHYFVALLPFLSVAFGITLSNIVSNVKPIEIIIFFSIITFFLTTDSYTFLLLVILIFLNAVYLYMKTYTNKNVNSLNRIIYYFSLFYLFLLFSILIYGAWQYIFQY